AKFEVATDNIVNQVPFSPDGSHLAVVPFSTDLLIIEAASGKVVRKLSHPDACRVARFSPDGRLLAVGTGGALGLPVGEVYFWDWREGKRVGRPYHAGGPVDELEFSADGALLVTGTVRFQGGSVQVWDVASGRALTDPVVGRVGLMGVAFHP